MIKYGYGLQCIESRSMYDKDRTYSINFYNAISPKYVGVFESHGITYLEARNMLKQEKPKERFGLELLIEK